MSKYPRMAPWKPRFFGHVDSVILTSSRAVPRLNLLLVRTIVVSLAEKRSRTGYLINLRATLGSGILSRMAQCVNMV